MMSNKMKRVHAEIQYIDEEGYTVHSDICPHDCLAKNLNDGDYKEFLHKCLDEWLEKGGGTGIFYVKEEEYGGIC